MTLPPAIYCIVLPAISQYMLYWLVVQWAPATALFKISWGLGFNIWASTFYWVLTDTKCALFIMISLKNRNIGLLLIAVSFQKKAWNCLRRIKDGINNWGFTVVIPDFCLIFSMILWYIIDEFHTIYQYIAKIAIYRISWYYHYRGPNIDNISYREVPISSHP